MADLNIALILKLVDKATAPARKATEALRRIGGGAFGASADRVHAGAIKIASGLGSISGGALRAATDLRTLVAGAGLLALGKSMIDQAAQFEEYEVQLKALEGSQEGAKKAMTWIEDFAVRTPLELADVVSAYSRLKAFGIDPTNGSLEALVDTMAATGGGSEKLDGLVLALGQSWTKGKLQGEEALQLLERGVPVYDILAKAMGKTTEEIVEMQSKGKLGREEIALLIEELGKGNAGASANMAKTWSGIMSNLADHWTAFQRRIMAAGVFDYLKERLQQLLDLLNAMADDGRLQAWAEYIAETMIWAFDGLGAFAVQVADAWRAVYPWIQSGADAVGGFGNAAAILIGLKFGTALISIASGFVSIALALGPVGWALTGIAAMAYVIYDSWENIVAYFTEKIERVRAAFDEGLLNGVLKTLSEFNPFQLMMDAAEGLFTYITGWTWDDVGKALLDAFAGINLYDTGVAILQSLWNGFMSGIDALVAAAQAKLAAIMPDWATAAGSGMNEPGASYTGMGGAMGDYNPYASENALGGPIRSGQLSWVGEEGPELFRPRTDGTIISTRQLKGAGGGSGGGTMSIGAININAAASQSPMDIARAVRAELEALAREQGFALHDGGLNAG
jgi:tape measure domain-containing protein